MNSLFTLLKVQLLSYFGINKLAHKKTKNGKKKILGLGALIFFMGALIFAISLSYSSMFAEMFFELGVFPSFLPFLFSIISFMIFMFAMGSVNGVVFGFKDYDMLMSLPVKGRTIVLSKLIYLYVSDLLLTAVIMISSLFSISRYGIYDFSFYIYYLISIFFVPLIPIALALIIGTLFAMITSRMKYKNLFQIILYIALFAFIFSSSFFIGAGNLDIFSSIGDIYIVAKLFDLALYNAGYLLLFIAISVVVVLIPATIVGVLFKKINTLLMSKSVSKKFVMKSSKNKGQLHAIFVRETKKLLSSPIYAINSLMGIIMLVGFTVMLAIMSTSLPDTSAVSGVFAIILPFIIGFIVTLSPTTASSISLEGKTFWIMKSSPISTNTTLIGKLLVHIVFYVPVSFLSALICGISLRIEFIPLVFTVLSSVAFAVFGGVSGLLMNLRFPMMNWENEAAAIKRGVSTIFTMLIGLAVTLVLGILAYILMTINFMASSIISFALISLITALFTYLLFTKGIKMYEKI